MHTSFISRTAALAALLLAGLAALPASAGTTTITFDSLATPPGVSGDALHFPDANGGSREVSGVTFNAATNSDWEVIGNSFETFPGSGPFGESHSGDYFLAGNAYQSPDKSFNGLTISTTEALSSLWVGYDNNGFNSNDSDSLTITAFGTGGDLASQTASLTSTTLGLVDTSGTFGSLVGVTGYRFTTNALSLYAAANQGYVIADDLTFKTPVPEASTTLSFSLLLALGLGGVLLSARKKSRAQA